MALEEPMDYLNLVLLILYTIVGIFSLFQFGRIFFNKHQLLSFHSVFLLFCFVWMLLRIILFSLLLPLDGSDNYDQQPTSTPDLNLIQNDDSNVTHDHSIPKYVYYPLLWLPLCIQFATYTLLVLFICRVTYKLNPETKNLWDEKYKRKYFLAWMISNAIFFLIVLIAIILICVDTIQFDRKGTAFVRYMIPGLVFLLLVILFSYYGFRLYRLLQNPSIRYVPFNSQGAGVPGVSILIMLLLAVFLCRTVYCLVIAFEALRHTAFFGEQPLFRFLSLFISEILPTFAILVFFRRIPSSKGKTRHLLPPVFYTSINKVFMII